MRIAILLFPGSYTSDDTQLAVQRAELFPEEFLWSEPAEKLAEFSGFVIVGEAPSGGSCTDVIAAFGPLVSSLKEQSDLGKPILGIAKGARFLVETGLVPGIENNQVGITLADTQHSQEHRSPVFIRLSEGYQRNAFTRHLIPKNKLSLPIARDEQRFIIPPGLLAEMRHNGLDVFHYCDANGQIIDEFAGNSNGSQDTIAAVSNKRGNVMAMIPSLSRTPAADPIFQSMRTYIKEGFAPPVDPLYYYPRKNAF